MVIEDVDNILLPLLPCLKIDSVGLSCLEPQ